MKNLVLIAGVSGSGKSRLSNAMKQNGFLRAITSTTRPPRVGEMDGVHYHFVTKELMRTLKEQGELVESAVVRGEIYGMTSNALDELFTSSENVYVILEPQGVKTYQEFFKNNPSYNVITLFLDCPRQVQVERVLNRLRDGYTEKQLNEASRALVSAREFEPEWKDMIDINVYYPFSKSSDDIEEIIEKIQKHLSRDLPFDRVATIPPKSSSPNKDEVERVSRVIKSGGFELEHFL